MNRHPTFLDLFAGGGGLSEGFIQAGFKPIAHVESDSAACYTLRTRMAYHWLKENSKLEIYINYLNGKLTRNDLYNQIPSAVLNTVINKEISTENLTDIFNKVDNISKNINIDVIIGGPPCQAYSLVGRSRDKNGMKDDKRNYLYKYYAKFLQRYNPTYFVFENVEGLLSAKDQNGNGYFDLMKDKFSKCGYRLEWKLLSSENYGVLQHRKRIILVGYRGEKRFFYPDPESWNPETTVDELFKDLPEIQAGEGSFGPCKMTNIRSKWLEKSLVKDTKIPVTLHRARPHNTNDLNIYIIAVDLWDKKKRRLNYNDLPEDMKTHRNRSSFIDRFKVVASDLPATHTLVSHIAKDGHYYIHPDIKQNRSITPREAARIQTFPDNYYFESISGKPAQTPAFKQIGNAVPVLLARKIAEKLREIW